jgi:hypothetical protein
MYYVPQLGQFPSKGRRRPSRRRPLSFLGKTTSTPPLSLSQYPASVQQAMQQLNIPTNDWMYNWTVQAVVAGYLPDYEPGVEAGNDATFTGSSSGCQTSTSTLKAQLTATIGSGAITAGKFATAANPIVGGALIAAGALLTGLSAIFGSHSKAVAAERGTLCAAVPMANAFLQQLDQYLAAGQVTAQTAAQGLQQLQSSFASETSKISNTSQMNEGAIYNRALQGIVTRRTLDLQSALGAGGTEALSLETGIPPAVMLIGAALAIWLLL